MHYFKLNSFYNAHSARGTRTKRTPAWGTLHSIKSRWIRAFWIESLCFYLYCMAFSSYPKLRKASRPRPGDCSPARVLLRSVWYDDGPTNHKQIKWRTVWNIPHPTPDWACVPLIQGIPQFSVFNFFAANDRQKGSSSQSMKGWGCSSEIWINL